MARTGTCSRTPGWKADNDTDRNSTGVNGVVSHALEYNTGTADSTDNGRETRLGTHPPETAEGGRACQMLWCGDTGDNRGQPGNRR